MLQAWKTLTTSRAHIKYGGMTPVTKKRGSSLYSFVQPVFRERIL